MQNGSTKPHQIARTKPLRVVSWISFGVIRKNTRNKTKTPLNLVASLISPPQFSCDLFRVISWIVAVLGIRSTKSHEMARIAVIRAAIETRY